MSDMPPFGAPFAARATKRGAPARASGAHDDMFGANKLALTADQQSMLPEGWDMFTHSATYGMTKDTQVACRAFYVPPLVRTEGDVRGEGYTSAVQHTRAALRGAQATLAAQGCKTTLFEETVQVAERTSGLQMSLVFPQWSSARPDDAELAKLKPQEEAKLTTFNTYMREHGQSLIAGVPVAEAAAPATTSPEAPLIYAPGQSAPTTLQGGATRPWRPGGGGFLSR